MTYTKLLSSFLFIFLISVAKAEEPPNVHLACEGSYMALVGKTPPVPLSITIESLLVEDVLIYVVRSVLGEFNNFSFGVPPNRTSSSNKHFIFIGQRFSSKHNELEVQEIKLNRLSGEVNIVIEARNNGKYDFSTEYKGICKSVGKPKF